MEEALLQGDLEKDEVLTGELLLAQTRAEAGYESSFLHILSDVWSMLDTE